MTARLLLSKENLTRRSLLTRQRQGGKVFYDHQGCLLYKYATFTYHSISPGESLMAKIIGIDLGTTNSLVAIVQGGNSVVIPTAEGGNLCPSVVGFGKSGEILVGQVA